MRREPCTRCKDCILLQRQVSETVCEGHQAHRNQTDPCQLKIRRLSLDQRDGHWGWNLDADYPEIQREYFAELSVHMLPIAMLL